MRVVKATDFVRQHGISRYTIRDICRRDTKLAFKKKDGHYYVRLSELAKRPGFDLVGAILASHSNWIKAIDLARHAGIPRRTVANWCLSRPNFAKRIGRVYYVDLEALGASEDQIQIIKNWAPNRRTTSVLSNLFTKDL